MPTIQELATSVAKLSDELTKVRDELTKTNSTAAADRTQLRATLAAAVLIAGVFGISGYNLWTTVRTLKTQVHELNEEVARARADLKADKARYSLELSNEAASAVATEVGRLAPATKAIGDSLVKLIGNICGAGDAKGAYETVKGEWIGPSGKLPNLEKAVGLIGQAEPK
jgi:hypothetical protein